MTVIDKDAERAIVRAKMILNFNHPFFATMIVMMGAIETHDVPTMATDGRSLWYNPDFVKTLKPAEVVFVLAHEVLHVAFKHHVRRQNRHPVLWNVSTDFVINAELKECGLQMPEKGLYDQRFSGMGAEEVYRILLDEMPPMPSGGQGDGQGDGQAIGQAAGQMFPGMDPGGCGSIIDAAPSHDKGALAEAEAEADRMVRQAAMVARSNPGKMSANMKRMIDAILEPVVDWKERLRRFIDDSMWGDYAWRKPNRRMLAHGYVTPGLIPDGLSHLIVCIDTSGSITQEDLTRYASEINAIFGDCAVDRITVIYADAKVCHIDRFEAGDELRFAMHGGGGTAFSDTFRWIRENAPDTSAVIYFTDLEVYDFGEQPQCPVLWAVTNTEPAYKQLSEKVPFGEPLWVRNV